MDNLEIFRWLITSMSMIGAGFNAKMTRRGLQVSYRIWVVANILWVGVFIYLKLWPEMFLFSFYFITATIGLFNTRKQAWSPDGGSTLNKKNTF